jgi:hypothetical protein
VWLLGLALFVGGAGFSFRQVARDPFWMQKTDFALYVQAADAIVSGRDPYDHRIYSEGRDMTFYGVALEKGDPYAYSPIVAEVIAALLPLGRLGLRVVWWLIGAGSVVASIVILFRCFGRAVRTEWVLLALGLLFTGRYLRSDLYHGQANLPLLLGLTVALKWFVDARPVRGGAMFGLVAACKPFLGIFVLYLAWRREWRAVLTTGIVAALALALSFMPAVLGGQLSLGGWLAISEYYSSPPHATRPDNQSLYGLFLRLFTTNPFTLPWLDAPRLVPVLMLVFAACAAVVVLRLTPARPIGRVEGAERATILLHAGLVYAFALGLGPLTQGDYLFYVVPGCAGVLLVAAERHAAGGRLSTRWSVVRVIWLAAFVQVFLPWLWYWGIAFPDDWVPIGGLRLLLTGRVGASLVICAAALAVVMNEEQRARTEQKSAAFATS